jgi:phosphoserine phosphatase RsbU/P
MMKLLKNRPLAFKLSFFILTACTLIFAVTFNHNYRMSRKVIIEKIEEGAKNLTLGTVNAIESVLRPVEKGAQHAARILENKDIAENEITHLLLSMLRNYPEIYGAAVAFEPYALDDEALYFARYFYRRGADVIYADLGTDEYNYSERDWYSLPKDLGESVWTEPYFGEGGDNELMVSYSVPFYRETDGKKVFTGTITVDILLEWLDALALTARMSRVGHAALISGEGTVIAHPDGDLILKKSLFEMFDTGDDEILEKILTDIAEEAPGVRAFRDKGTREKVLVAYAPVPVTGWTLVISFPKKELMSELISLNRDVVMLGISGILLLFALIVLISGTITRPLRLLASKTNDIARGDLDVELPDSDSTDEVGGLTRSFTRMRDSLKEYLNELTKSTAEKERIKSELRIAHDIQMGTLPKVFPAFPDRPEFDVHATLIPAKEVGGDFYDFYFIDDDNLCFTIGDVSGKGVPAALFMAITKTLLKSIAKISKSPEEVLFRVNKDLVVNNSMDMFVSIFFGVLNIRTGKVSYVNAGHNSPLIIRKGKPPEYLNAGVNTVAGIFEDASFRQETITLAPADALHLYTDGVTEALGPGKTMFSDDRLRDEIKKLSDPSAKEMVETTIREVTTFSRGVLQSDDITVLALRYLGKDGSGGGITPAAEEYRIRNDISEISKAVDLVADFAGKNGFSGELIGEISVSLEELVHNIIAYGYDDEDEHIISIRMGVRDGEMFIEIIDDGRAFDPLQAPAADTKKTLEEREEGGLGIHIARGMTDRMEYRREAGRNVLMLIKNIQN